MKNAIYWFRRDLRLWDKELGVEAVFANRPYALARDNKVINELNAIGIGFDVFGSESAARRKIKYPPHVALHEEQRAKCLTIFKRVNV